MPESSILDTAIAAHNAGLCPIRAKTDGSKAPFGPWKAFTENRPDMADVMTWFPSWPNVGIVMGAISDRLVCLEMEGRFMEDFDTAIERLKAADLGGVLENWINGYSEKSPGGGIHILVHVGGDGPVPGNIKVASDSLHQTLIETRGEGGFLIVAPSNGSTHPSGGKWEMIRGSFDEIAWATPEEFAGVLGVLASFNVERVSGGERVSPPVSPRHTFEGESRFDQFLDTLPSVADYLASIGWEPCGQDAEGIHMRRPGKTDPGKSGSINHNGRLYVFSSSTPLTPSEQLGHRTYDVLDIMLAYDYGRNPTADERTERFRQWRGGQYSPLQVASPQVSGGDTGGQSSPPDLWLPPEFWAQRPVLQAIHDGALRRLLSPDAVFGAFLSSYATTVPASIVVPAIATAISPLNTYCVLVARSGGGKTGAMRTALELLGYPENEHPDVLLDIGLRSGEGLITAATRPKTKDDPDPGHRQGVQVCFDEGGMLSRQTERSGATILPYLITAWAGAGTVGGYVAAESRSFPASQVRVCAVLGIQYGAAANLFTGDAERTGFPQRLLFFGLDSPELDEIDVSQPRNKDIDPVGVTFWQHGEFRGRRMPLTFPEHIEPLVSQWTLDKSRGRVPEALDGHKMLLQLRTAGLLALMDGRGVVNDEDWQLADCVCATSRAIRTTLVRSLGDVVDERHKAQGRADFVKSAASDALWLDQRAQRIARHAQQATEGLTLKMIKGMMSHSERQRRDEILEHARTRGWLVVRDGRHFAGGER